MVIECLARVPIDVAVLIHTLVIGSRSWLANTNANAIIKSIGLSHQPA